MDTTTPAHVTRREVGTDAKRAQIRCNDCGAFVFADEGGAIRHSRRCDFASDRTHFAPSGSSTVAAPQSPRRPSDATIVRAAQAGSISNVLSDDEIVGAVRVGLVSVSDAMNRDF